MSQDNTSDFGTVSADQTTWEYNGYEFEIDLSDLEFAEKYEFAMKNLSAREKTSKKDGGLSDRIKDYDDMIRCMFNDIFGEGAGDDILGNIVNTRNCDKALDSLFGFVAAQQVANANETTRIVEKYSKYSSNRATRRAGDNRRNG